MQQMDVVRNQTSAHRARSLPGELPVVSYVIIYVHATDTGHHIIMQNFFWYFQHNASLSPCGTTGKSPACQSAELVTCWHSHSMTRAALNMTDRQINMTERQAHWQTDLRKCQIKNYERQTGGQRFSWLRGEMCVFSTGKQARGEIRGGRIVVLV